MTTERFQKHRTSIFFFISLKSARKSFLHKDLLMSNFINFCWPLFFGCPSLVRSIVQCNYLLSKSTAVFAVVVVVVVFVAVIIKWLDFNLMKRNIEVFACVRACKWTPALIISFCSFVRSCHSMPMIIVYGSRNGIEINTHQEWERNVSGCELIKIFIMKPQVFINSVLWYYIVIVSWRLHLIYEIGR